MRWLIVEDALRNRQGHWLEYIRTFTRGLRALGDEVTVLADQHAQPFISEGSGAECILPESIWHRMSDGSGLLKRYLRVPVHAWKTYNAVRSFLEARPHWDVIFVPTVLVHHLLGWTWLIKRILVPNGSLVLLFFPNLPIQLDPDTPPAWARSPTTRLMRQLFAWLRTEIEARQVILGVETWAMQQAFSALSGLPVAYLPHPIEPGAPPRASRPQPEQRLVMASYGAARFEKGSDLVQTAIGQYCREYPQGKAQFVLQWIEDFKNPSGETVAIDRQLQKEPRVEYITDYFADREYEGRLAHTDVLLLPYRRSSYGLRVSRVAIEAMVNGIPLIATAGTTLAAQAARYGTHLECADENPASLAQAIRACELRQPELRDQALARKDLAVRHFSIAGFREELLGLQPVPPKLRIR